MQVNKDQRLKDKIAIITGGARGIGKAIAKRYAKEGAKIIIADLKEKESMETKDEIENDGGEAIFIKSDVSTEASVKNMLAKTIETYDKVDILVNNAGVSFNKPVWECTLEEYDHVFKIDLRGVWMCCREVSLPMMKNKSGRIINIASTAGAIAQFPDQSIYSAAKGGVIQLTRALAIELCTYGINVNCIAPSYVETPIFEEVGWSLKIKENREKINKMVPCGRIGKVDEIAGAAFFLASDDASYVIGHTLFVDGGVMSW